MELAMMIKNQLFSSKDEEESLFDATNVEEHGAEPEKDASGSS